MKKEFVNKIFHDISDKYDLMNDIVSFRLHKLWKKKFVNHINLNKNKKNNILDIGCGTGDIVSIISENKSGLNSKTKTYLLDPNINMIKQGIKKLKKKDITWIASYGELLPFKNNKFDVVMMSFSLRNVENINKTLKEINRVLKKDGQFICLEFGKIENLALNSIYKIYSENFIPEIGKIVTGNKKAYEYLIDSIKRFPEQNKIIRILKSKKFHDVNCYNLTFGVVAIYSCKKK